MVLLLYLSLWVTSSTSSPGVGGGGRKMDSIMQEEFCKNFTYGDPTYHRFYSPRFPLDYPPGISCSKIITAEPDHFVRVDFRDFFHVEPPSNEGACEYDYLEVRDGQHGYSPLIGKYCDNLFPPIITSSGDSLWLRFVSDWTIEYKGFKAVYEYLENPLENLTPSRPPCQFEVGGATDFIGHSNISEEHITHAEKYGMPIDCTWVIQAEHTKRVYIQFTTYELNEPNDCNFNFIQIFDGKPDIEHREKYFCGSITESYTSKSDILYVRYYADGRGIGSEFVAVFTALREIADNEECTKEEYDCDDATCIAPDLVCNGVRNCKFGWDEESCAIEGSGIPLDFSATHVILIIICLVLIMMGMCAGMVYNLVRKLTEDREDILASRERSLASLAASAGTLGVTEEVRRSSRGSHVTQGGEECNGCYVPAPPGGGFPFSSRQ